MTEAASGASLWGLEVIVRGVPKPSHLLRPTIFDAMIGNDHLDCLEEAGFPSDVPFNRPETLDIDSECLVNMSGTSPDSARSINNNIIWRAFPPQLTQLVNALERGDGEASLQRIEMMQRLLSKLDQGVRLIAGIPQTIDSFPQSK